MSQFHRERPELVGTDRDPWMRIEGYRKLVRPSEEELALDRDERDAIEEAQGRGESD